MGTINRPDPHQITGHNGRKLLWPILPTPPPHPIKIIFYWSFPINLKRCRQTKRSSFGNPCHLFSGCLFIESKGHGHEKKTMASCNGMVHHPMTVFNLIPETENHFSFNIWESFTFTVNDPTRPSEKKNVNTEEVRKNWMMMDSVNLYKSSLAWVGRMSWGGIWAKQGWAHDVNTANRPTTTTTKATA